jgi:hypothetical protein
LENEPSRTYGIRRFNPNRSNDTQLYKDMDRHPKALEFMVPPRPLPRKKLDETIRTDESSINPNFQFAVVDNIGGAGCLVQFYLDDMTEDVRSLVKLPPDALILEVSYKKLFAEWPKGKWWIKDLDNLIVEEPKEVAVSGIRQTAVLIRQK